MPTDETAQSSDDTERCSGDLNRFAIDCALRDARVTELWIPADPDFGFVDYFEAAAARNLGLLSDLEELGEDIDRRGIVRPSDGEQARLVTDGGTDRLTIHLNGAEHTVPNTAETEADILRAVDLDPAGYRLYRDADVEALGPEQLVGEPGQIHLSDPVVVSEGDEFVAIPRGCHDA